MTNNSGARPWMEECACDIGSPEQEQGLRGPETLELTSEGSRLDGVQDNPGRRTGLRKWAAPVLL